ncbi:MAG: PAS domain S-box protein [Candidatus Scalindua sp.]|jgi:PAS domain S-box-containing protein|nr:PAS domain S-box protein [Candidatus Scalindua sp.]MBT5307413.1 PAS domain S-box protein [Candidatus Scalindua sp.]MBT6229333.1 PAS domain S-box protein [Candidatus Scalindua sp.]MBT7213048.1 PAS domain S-box protein [Candidatus Scalindua sp.]MBT7590841.1 PAS domain S-box protein [Candidatus Scalindua sp.]
MVINKSYLIKILVIVAGYFILAKLGLLMAFKQTNASPVWPPTGFAIAVIFLWGYRVWPGILIGAFLINALTFIWNDVPLTTSVLMSFGIGTGNTLEAIMGAFFILRFSGTNDPFSRTHNVFKFVTLTAMVATVISASVGVLCLCAGDVVEWSSFGYTWWTWWVGDAVGALVIVPVVLAWVKETPISWKYHQYLLACFILIILLGVLYITYGISEQNTFILSNRLEYLTIPIIVLSTFMFGRLGATNTVLLSSVIAVLFTINGHGPFVMEFTNDSLLLLQTYMAVLTIVSLFLTGELSERKMAENKLKELNEKLESRVSERTANLKETNEQLRTEIVERGKTEETLHKLYQAIEQSSSIVVITDIDGKIEYVNSSFTKSTGYRIEEVIGNNPRIIKSGKTPRKAYKELWQTITAGSKWTGEFCNKKKNGELYWEFASISPVKNAEGVITNFIAVKDDITERKEIERTLKLSEEKYRTLVETTNTIPWEFDPSTGKFTFIGSHAVELFGYSIDEWYKENFWSEHIHPDDREKTVRLCMEYTQRSEDHQLEYRMMTEDNSIIWVYDVIQVIECDNDTKRLRGIIINITERKKMEEVLFQSEKLKSIGTITAGISHDFNNILSIISGNVQLLQNTYKDHGKLMDALRTVKKAVDDGAQISRNMLTFTKTKQDNKEFVSFDTRDLIIQSIDFTKPRWKNEAQSRGIKYQIDTEGVKSISSIMCNPAEVREVFINIINNALDAMPEGGSISFSTWCDNDTAFIGISDTGEGMPGDVMKKIFDPFFTTKLVAGTGLGMSMAYGIITRHGGKIEVESKLGEGSTFTLQFPTTSKGASQKSTSEPGQEIKHKNLRILVVDDEVALCTVLDEFLSESGQKVTTVYNGADAIGKIKTESYDLILCDLAMQNITGYDVIKAVSELENKPKTGIITGWREKLNGEGVKVDFILRKPFNLSELTKHINVIFSADSRR